MPGLQGLGALGGAMRCLQFIERSPPPPTHGKSSPGLLAGRRQIMIGRRGVSKPTPTADLEALPDREKPATAACCSSRRLLLLAVSALFATLLFREGSAARFPMLTTLEAAPAQMDSDHSLHIAGSINPAAAAAAAAAATTAATSTSASSASATQVLWRPSPDSAGIQEARQAHASLGLVTLGGGESDSFVLGVRPSTGTVEVVSPASLPSFSYTLPMKDPSVRLHWGGSGRHPLPLDRSAEGFHHLGDVTMRALGRLQRPFFGPLHRVQGAASRDGTGRRCCPPSFSRWFERDGGRDAVSAATASCPAETHPLDHGAGNGSDHVAPHLQRRSYEGCRDRRARLLDADEPDVLWPIPARSGEAVLVHRGLPRWRRWIRAGHAHDGRGAGASCDAAGAPDGRG